MKSFIAIIFALTCVFIEIKQCQSKDITASFKEVSEMCQNSENTPQHMVEKLRSGNFDVKDMEREAMCHVKCVMEGFNVLENGSLSEKIFVRKMGPHIGDSKAQELFDFCKKENDGDGDECEKPFKVFACLQKLSDIFKY